MKALVINPWIYDFAAYDLWSKPIGLFKLIYILDKLNFEIDYIDCLDRFHPTLLNIKKPSRYLTEYGDGKYLTEKVKKPKVFSYLPRNYKRYGLPRAIFQAELARISRPDIIFVNSGMTYWYQGPFEAIKLAKELFAAPVVLGGIYAMLCTEHARESSCANAIYTGHTERELINLLNELLDAEFKELPLNNLDFYYTGYRHYADIKYITMRTSKGCPYRCGYCGWYMVDEEFIQYDDSEIVNLVEYYVKKGINNFAFYDDALLYKPAEHFLRIFKESCKREIVCNFHTPNGLHFEFIDIQVANTMKNARFIKPRLGLEDIRLKARKNERFINSVNNLIEAGYDSTDIYANILVGINNQTPNDVYRTIDFAAKLGIRIHLEEYSPVPGSDDFQKIGLALDADPLLHNNTAYLLMHPIFAKEIDRIKNTVRVINQSHSKSTTKCKIVSASKVTKKRF